MQFLVAIYEENNEVYTALGLTIEECRVIIADTIAKARIIWEDEEIEEEDEPDTLFPEDSPSGILNTLIRWGWLKSDFDEKLNTYIISFPEYSQLFTELFQKLRQKMTAGRGKVSFRFTVLCLRIIRIQKKIMIF